ncbi:methyltransferase family protein [Amphiplicatus metriothermophilus]|uniref:Protein-S-isoprenylcysteine O-methyltransferase Ste14 n=1 Tax=Amphiplicatus metriothermophilus TaxID=1519374 RepID=A0A239PP41_9PROT|nr:isoprenylcysteine carboxylmethyltransferase family protein [Amphiplicatus metriothermophilus]MBB5518781.1 protein-S-isoprenylcysteine O-methyltransferase Ste14 [Amphiplicatus metriothermophilus]SNT72064.1 Protein-S-isoprenylcysteine O-methyltransferase Ste14 [Amphiplicatus metriothermophilus]
MMDAPPPNLQNEPPREEDEGPKVRVHPPTVMFAALVAGFLVRLYAGGSLPLPRALAEGLGGFLIILALGILMAATRAFNEAGETLQPNTPSKRLLTEGPYRFSRNPVYLAMMIFGAGFGIATSNVWIVLTTALAGVILHFFAIKPEEAYLERRFGDAFAEYRRRVRRWI